MIPTALKNLPFVHFPAGTTIIEEGEPLKGLYFLETGEVEVRKKGLLILAVDQPGAVFGEMSWLMETTPTATVVALKDCELRHVADPAAFCKENPDVALFMARTLARRLDSLNRYVVAVKEEFKEHNNHLGILDEVLDSLAHKQPRHIPRRNAGH